MLTQEQNVTSLGKLLEIDCLNQGSAAARQPRVSLSEILILYL